MKKLATLGTCLIALTLVGCDKNEVGDVSLGLFTTKDIKINTLVDPEVTGVTCHVASIEADLDLADPSDSAISCRQTGEITPEMLANVDRSKSGEIVFKKSKSILFKTMKIRRIYDEKSKTLMYVSYSTKETSGSYKHSLSTVPLWGTKAYAALVANETLPEVTESSTSQPNMTTEDESEKSSDPIF
ncbi:protein creA [Vibrio ishigakensis]|uniref:Protein creA n=1 Tax=Vibrio ishigakensis TaxID=1481914 RepID=A0A0B8NRI4_9VIBR|nr:CreA family protein [Vibrio ishigakensis]GAM57185.1 protein creA [Vibrio ishigakensis]